MLEARSSTQLQLKNRREIGGETFRECKSQNWTKCKVKIKQLKEESRFPMKARVTNFLLKFMMSVYMPRSARLVVLATIGLLTATAASTAIQLVSGFSEISPMCVPYDSCCPGVMWAI